MRRYQLLAVLVLQSQVLAGRSYFANMEPVLGSAALDEREAHAVAALPESNCCSAQQHAAS